ncbi:MAG: MnmC family methyltransferase [bacterium]
MEFVPVHSESQNKNDITKATEQLELIPITTEDGTVSLYNFTINDVYHSKIGAYTEALYKYTVPSGILEFVKHNNEVKILDICFGLGYNSKVAVSEIFKINPECKITINALEIDPKVLALSCILFNQTDNNFIEKAFFDAISKQINVVAVLEEYTNNVLKYSPNLTEILPSCYKSIDAVEIKQKLHNIYYRTISSRNSRGLKTNPLKDLLTINIFTEDARKAIKLINTEHDYIFHDPFTPSKAPVLWTVDFFNELFRILSPNGNLTTYSSSAPVRAGLIEAGFFVGRTEPVGKKTSGTIAYKNIELLKNFLTSKEKGLLETNAGIPYYDENLINSSESILKNRELIQKNSDRVSSSKFLKSFL